MKKYFVFLFIICVILFSCERENEILDSTQNEIAPKILNIEGIEVGSENGYLVLKNFNDVIQLVTLLENVTDEELEVFNQKHCFTSAYVFRKEQNIKLMNLKDETTAQSIIEELKSEGYFDSETNSMAYPFVINPWAKVLNKEGIIKINNSLLRFWKDNQICSEASDLDALIKVSSNEDIDNFHLKNSKIISNTQGEKISENLKSLPIPNYDHQFFSTGYFDTFNWVAGKRYVRRTNLYSLIVTDYSNNVSQHYVYVGHLLFVEGFLGIWFDYYDYLYFKFFDLTIGGNPKSSDSGYGNHDYTDYHCQYPSTGGGLIQRAEHSYYLYDDSFYPSIPNYLTPYFGEFKYEYWTNKVPSKGWLIID
ncbi:MAG: hypothetical protein K9H26_00370 [Prolixibacteraceae bacterium]|nr:hypothetical protein [Prolixibacteraceae bacterium]